MKKAISILMCIIMVCSLMTTDVSASLFNDVIGGKESGTLDYSGKVYVCENVVVSSSLTLTGSGKYNRANTLETSWEYMNMQYSRGPLFTVKSGGVLTIRDNVVVTSVDNDPCDWPLICVESGGKLILEGNAILEEMRGAEKPAVQLESGAVFEMRGGTIQDVNHAINMKENSTYTMTGGTIRRCKGMNGAAIYCKEGTVNIQNAVFDTCGMSGNGFGGAMFLDTGSSLTVANTIIKNSSSCFGGAMYIASGVTYPDLSSVTFENNKSTYGDQPECQNVYASDHNTSKISIPEDDYYLRYDYEAECFRHSEGIVVKKMDGTVIPVNTSITPYIGQKLQYSAGNSPTFGVFSTHFIEFTVHPRPALEVVVNKLNRTMTVPAGYRYNMYTGDLSDKRWNTTTTTTQVPLPIAAADGVFVYKKATENSFRSEVKSFNAAVGVTFDAQGGTIATNEKSVDNGKAYGTLPDATKTGYKFAGWFTAVTGGSRVTQNTLVSNGADHTLYARYTPISYTVKFDKNTGTGSQSSVTAVYDQPQNVATSSFSKSGYTFMEWNTAANGSGTVVCDQGLIKNLTATDGATVTLYSQWTDMRFKDGYFEISNLDQLKTFRDMVNNGNLTANAKLTADIDMSSINDWKPIAASTGYKGIFEGNNRKLKNMKIKRRLCYGQVISTDSSQLYGFIGRVEGAVKNLSFENISIDTDQNFVGTVAGANRGLITNCHILSGSICGREQVGGIVGQNESGAYVRNCSNQANIANLPSPVAQDYMGGIAGANVGSSYVENCFNTGSMGKSWLNCYNIGGIVGKNAASHIRNCYNIGKVSPIYENDVYIAQLVGRNDNGALANVKNCYYLENNGTSIAFDRDIKNSGNVTANALKTTVLTSLNNWRKDQANQGDYLAWELKSGADHPTFTAPSTDATLKGIKYKVDGGKEISLSGFSSSKYSYTVDLPCDFKGNKIDLTYTPANSQQRVEATSADILTGYAIGKLKVTADAGNQNTYQITFKVKSHNFGNYINNNDGTCSSNATKTRVCSSCHLRDTVEIPNSKDSTKHMWGGICR